MSYETYRSDMVYNLSRNFQDDEITRFLSVMDEVARRYEFRVCSTDLIVPEGIPDVVKLFIASKHVEGKVEGTLQNYFSTLRRFFLAVRKPPERITTNDLRGYISWYKSTYGVKNNTMEHKRTILNGFFEWLVDEEVINRNPMRKALSIKCDEPERLPMTAVELEQVRASCRSVREKATVDMLYSTACRVSEFCALKIKDVDFANKEVHIARGKGGKGRTTFLNAEAEVSLKKYLATRTDSDDALFITMKKPYHQMHKRTVEEEINRIVSRCELPMKVTPHIFRHTAASLALQRGMPIDQVQKFLGHARIQTTLRYAKILNIDVKFSHQKFVA